MSLVTIKKRRQEKTLTVAGQVPTVPTAPDHFSAGWLVTDIYIGEWCFNSADAVWYYRAYTGIKGPLGEVGAGAIKQVDQVTVAGTVAYVIAALGGKTIGLVFLDGSRILSTQFTLVGTTFTITDPDYAAGGISPIRNGQSLVIQYS